MVSFRPGAPDLERWWEIRVGCRPEQETAVVLRLGRAGCRAMARDSEGSDRVVLRAYLLAAVTPPHAVSGLYLTLLTDASTRRQTAPDVSWRQIRWDQWPDDVVARLQPAAEIGRRLRIQPASEPADGGHRIVVRLHPAAAFGNGLHPTTRLCLEALEEILADDGTGPPPALVDLGTGSGILAIAAMLLGAGSVHAADTDVLSVRAARANRDLNGISPLGLPVHLGSVDALAATARRPVDGVLCNMLAAPLLPLVPLLVDLAGRRSWAVVSGFRAEQEGPLRDAFRACRWAWNELRWSDDGWGCLVARGPEG